MMSAVVSGTGTGTATGTLFAAGIRHNSKEASSNSDTGQQQHHHWDDDNQTTVTASSATTVPTSNRTKPSCLQQSSKRTVTFQKRQAMAKPYLTIEDFLNEQPQEAANALLDNEDCLALLLRTLVVAENLPPEDRGIVEKYRKELEHRVDAPPPIAVAEVNDGLSVFRQMSVSINSSLSAGGMSEMTGGRSQRSDVADASEAGATSDPGAGAGAAAALDDEVLSWPDSGSQGASVMGSLDFGNPSSFF